MINSNIQKSKYDLEERCWRYAKRVGVYVVGLPRNDLNVIYGRQLIRCSSSVGANYIEANEALSKKDFSMRVKISRKEAKESEYWIKLTNPLDEQNNEKASLLKEVNELRKIFGAIVEKTK
jgi:four helix bundle protein